MSELLRQKALRKERIFAAILGAVVIGRLGFAALVFARPELAFANDTDRYVPIANAILSGQAYAWNTERPGELLNTIGYPLFLAGVFGVLGHEAGVVALAQLLTTGAVAVILFALLRRWLGGGGAFVAAILLALDPLTILWSMTILTESLFAVTLGIGAVLLVAWAHSQDDRTLVLAGVLSGLACLVKPFAILIVVAWAACLQVFPQHEPAARITWVARGVRRGLLFLLPSIMLIAPWFVRNAQLWNCPTLSSVDRVTLRDYMAAKVLAEAARVGLHEAQQLLQESDPGVCPSQTAKYWGIILANPGIYVQLHVVGTVPVLIATNFDRWLQYLGADYSLPDLWRPYMDHGWGGLMSLLGEEMREYPQGLGLMLALTAFQVLLYVLALAGAIAAIRLPSRAARWNAIVLLMTFLILVLTPGQGGHERFRVPAQPLLAILIGYAVAGRMMLKQRTAAPPPGIQGA
ncbi:MAG: glycosyltransferase family 39 protein [Chloroflexota bacterium]